MTVFTEPEDSANLPDRLHLGEAASIERMLERLDEELSASHSTHASDQLDLKAADEKLNTVKYDNARLEFRCASLFEQLMKSERRTEDLAKAHEALVERAREIAAEQQLKDETVFRLQSALQLQTEKLRTLEHDNARLEFRCASLFEQLMKSERRAEDLAKAHEALDAQDKIIIELQADRTRLRGRFSSRLAAFTQFCVYRLGRHGLLRPSYAHLAASGLFDKEFYLEQNPDVGKGGHNPLLHYLLHGAREGRDPSPLFNSSWYLRAYPDVAASRINPLLHYYLHGAAEGRGPLPMR